MMKKVRIEDAVGMVLAHDITRIVPGKFKGVGFKKGHVVRPEDLDALRRLGKEHLFALKLGAGRLHEDEAALRIARAISGPGLDWTAPVEGKSNIVSRHNGLLKIDLAGLLKINSLGETIVSTLKTGFPCRKDQVVAATRIIPLTTAARKIERLEALAARFAPVISVRPFRPLVVGVVVTGTEIFKGLIHDGFDTHVRGIILEHGATIARKITAPDDTSAIAAAIRTLVAEGCDMVITTGGLSVDPDDVTAAAIRRSGARVIAYGAPVLPGAMFLYARLGDTPVLGLPACVYYHSVTIFNLVFPWLLAGETLTKKDIAAMGHGGLCLNCEVCRFPVCPYGR